MASEKHTDPDIASGLLFIIEKQGDTSLFKTVRVQAVHYMLWCLRRVINTAPWHEMEDLFLTLFRMLQNYEQAPTREGYDCIRTFMKEDLKRFIEQHKALINERWQ